jgi:hypothetical protein
MCTRRSRPSTLNPLMIKIVPHIFLNRVPFDGARRGPWACTGGGRAARPGMFAAYAAWSAREIELQALATLIALAQILHTVCRSFPKISSALSAKVCGGSRSAKILSQALSSAFESAGARRGPWACTGGGRASRRSVVCTRDRVAGAGYACSARPDLHTVCRSFLGRQQPS